jgi:DNA-binding NarL/FixJ family response regulator
MTTILLVDDDITLRTALARYLTNRSYTVQDAGSGEQALIAFAENPADVVVSDIIMPGIDGFEFCRQLRASREGQIVPFIFLSSRGEVEDRIQGHAIGADDYMVKPFEPRELLAKVESHLNRVQRISLEVRRLVSQDPSNKAEVEKPVLPLTPAEERVFWEVVQGYTNRQVGNRLFISPRTVQTHLSNILSKLSLENRSQLVRYAYERGYQPIMSQIEPGGEEPELDEEI